MSHNIMSNNMQYTPGNKYAIGHHLQKCRFANEGLGSFIWIINLY